MIGIIDYGAGNITSVGNAIRKLGHDFFVSSDPSRLERAAKLIMPGVGEAYSAMESLKNLGIVDWLRGRTVPFLGICLGMQVLFTRSDERNTECLGIIEGTISRFAGISPAGAALKIPHMGWNKIERRKDDVLYNEISPGSYFYFVHSYKAPLVPETLGETEYGEHFTSLVRKGNFAGAQFHPEKSGEAGLQLLKNFIELC